MSDYDNTNRGAAFKPFDDQKFILQGKLDIDGKEYPIVVMQMTSKNGNKRLEVYQKMGAIFEEKDKTKENMPDYSGPLDMIDGNLQMAGWKGQSEKGHYLSLKVSERLAKKEEGVSTSASDTPVGTDSLDDEVPF